jgi:ubiquinone/menaquinone biosynthesis C-methylase UbiE
MTTETYTAEGWQLEKNSAEAYERYLASAFRPWADQLVEVARIQEGDRVLDVACGTGIVARSAAVRAGVTGSVVGIDLNADMLAVARRASGSVRPAIEWRQGNAVELPFPDGSFDVVLCEQAIQFFSEPVRALVEMRRVLTRSGRAAVSVCRPIAYSRIVLTSSHDTIDKHIRLRKRPHEDAENMVRRFQLIDREFRRLAPQYVNTVVIDRDNREFHERDGLIGIIEAAGLPMFREIPYERIERFN